MKKTILRAVALLLGCCLLLPLLTGCAQLDIYRHFLTGNGTKDPAEGAVPPPQPGTDGSTLTLSYDESVRLSGEFIALEDVQTNDELLLYYDEELSDDTGFTLRSVGVGSGTLVYAVGGQEIRVSVSVQPARLALFFLLGERDARGTRAPDDALLRAADGRVYYTFPEYGERYDPETVDDYVPEWLTENYYSKTYTDLLCKTNELTAAGDGKYAGLSAPLAYKWAEQTGEHVWIVNLAEVECSILDLLPTAAERNGTNDYRSLCALASSISETLAREYDAGHYEHARTGWFLFQGEYDLSMPAQDYFDALTALTTAMTEALTFTYGPETYTPTFGGMIGARARRTGDFTQAAISGPRGAQLCAAGADGALSSLYLLADPASWFSNDLRVSEYFAKYDRHKFLIYYGYEPPATLGDLYTEAGDYTARALNEIAAAAVENLLYLTGLRQKPHTTPLLTLVSYNGIDPVADYMTLSYGDVTVAAAPIVSPLWAAKEMAATVSLSAEGRTADLCRMHNLQNGDVVSIRWSAGGQEESRSLPVQRVLRFAMSDYPAEVSRDADNHYHLLGYNAPWSYGYSEQASGAFTPYPDIHYAHGWLYDGKNIWAGHGGVCHVNAYHFGPLDNWDSAYAFEAPEPGQLTVSFEAISAGKSDYLLAICQNGRVVWPVAADTPADRASFFTVRRDMTLDELNAAIAEWSVTVQKGDRITFVARRSANGLTAEGSVQPVVTIE